MKTVFTLFRNFLFIHIFFTSNLFSQSILIKDLIPGNEGLKIKKTAQISQRVLFLTERQYPELPRLGVTDGTASGTYWLKSDIPEYDRFEFYPFQDKVLFFTYDTSYTLWQTDGSKEATFPLKSINHFFAYSKPVIFKDKFIFIAEDEMGMSALWQSDGTEEGTFPFASFDRKLIASYGSRFYIFDSDLYFATQSREAGQAIYTQIWKLNEQDLSLSLVSDKENFHPGEFHPSSHTLFFLAQDEAHGLELWGINKLRSSPFLIKDIVAGEESGIDYVPSVKLLNDKLLFAANDRIHGRELWISDGTTEGTQMLLDITTGVDDLGRPLSSRPANFQLINNRLVFTLSDYYSNSSLYATDGTLAGTSEIMSLLDLGCEPPFYWHTRLGSSMIFSVSNNSLGREYWITDGTAANSHIIKDIHEGPGSSWLTYQPYISDLITLPSTHQVFFSAHDGVHGFEPWLTDGTDAGTRLIEDIFSGAGWSMTSHFHHLGDRMIALADNGETGQEWRLLDLDFEEKSQPSSPLLWSEKIGPKENLDRGTRTFLNGLATDSEDHVITNTRLRSFYRTHFYENQSISEATEPFVGDVTVISRFMPSGDLLWSKSIAAANWDESHISMGNDNSVFVAGTLHEKSSFDSIKFDLGWGQEAGYIAKLNASGKYEWVSRSSVNSSGIYIDAITTDTVGNVYVAGRYERQPIRWGDIRLNSEKNRAFFLFKLNVQGIAVWGTNLQENVDSYWKIADIEVSSEGKLYLLYTSGTVEDPGSCNFKEWYVGLDCFSSEGELLWTKNLLGSDYSIVTDLEIGPLGDMLITGRFRDTLYLDNQHLFSGIPDNPNECKPAAPFVAHMDKDGNIINATNIPFSGTAFQARFNPDRSFYLLAYLDRLPRDPINGLPIISLNGTRKLAVYHFDYWHRLLAEKDFYLRHNNAERFAPKLAINSLGDIVVASEYFIQVDSFSNSWAYDYNQYVYLMQFSTDLMQKASPDHPFNEHAAGFSEIWKVGPNPSSGNIWIHSQPENLRDFHYEIYSVQGHLLESGKKTGKLIRNSISLEPYPPGMYMVTLRQGNKREVYKILRQ